MICTYCGEKVELSPSANDRAKKFGGSPRDYTALFPNHSVCSLAAREKETRELMARVRGDGE